MPSTKTATHPKCREWKITFTEDDHTYIDSEGISYASGTGFVGAFFPKFDAKAKAAEIAARDGVNADDLLREWKRNRDEACEYGTYCHEYAEQIITGAPRHKPRTDKERHAFRAIDRALVRISKHFIILGCERVIFAPCAHLCGTIDLSVKSKRTGVMGCLDWKTNKELHLTAPYGGNARKPIAHMPDCNGAKYQLQLSVYAHIMRIGEYVDLDRQMAHGVIWLPPMSDEPEFIKIPDLRDEAESMVSVWERGYFGQELQAADYLKSVTERKVA